MTAHERELILSAEQGNRAPFGADLRPDFRDERFEAGERDALGGQAVETRRNLRDSPIWH